MITINLKRVSGDFHLEATNETGNALQLDASPEVGGTGKGMRPMQLLLAALGGCSSVDLVMILKKQKQELEDLSITVTGEREKDKVPSLYTAAHIHFKLVGNLDKEKVEKAIVLAVDKYCSVAKTLEQSATITHSFEILPQTI
jgi:putative redox protein